MSFSRVKAQERRFIGYALIATIWLPMMMFVLQMRFAKKNYNMKISKIIMRFAGTGADVRFHSQQLNACIWAVGYT